MTSSAVTCRTLVFLKPVVSSTSKTIGPDRKWGSTGCNGCHAPKTAFTAGPPPPGGGLKDIIAGAKDERESAADLAWAADDLDDGIITPPPSSSPTLDMGLDAGLEVTPPPEARRSQAVLCGGGTADGCRRVPGRPLAETPVQSLEPGQLPVGSDWPWVASRDGCARGLLSLRPRDPARGRRGSGTAPNRGFGRRMRAAWAPRAPAFGEQAGRPTECEGRAYTKDNRLRCGREVRSPNARLCPAG